ncbi:hamartin [Sabethes cyaneus]|uniref:hamartin n=1 Tax=Sabethes cyaneus TaxID=53552 RepID=UPI00237DA017|nr:hamartin [Sabethes cyaneus]XP_053682685.1 hamartin [Sabethes cyaneus]XP_053682686.1 hamartin [Sabethes cyaneus]
MDVTKLFSDLESNNLALADDSKKRFSELFTTSRESWLSHSMMDYFGQTSSVRIVDILVKVQQPHDKFILDKLAEWIRSGSNKMLALTLFGHIIQKRPSWLCKVGSHQLVKEMLKLSKMEKEIIPLINAVLCIINLLPVIPLVMGGYIQDLFEIFNYLATFDRNTSVNLPEDQLIHLQFGLYELFNRLYGMYPCNFVTFLKREYRGEKQAIFQHTIKPLLDTVKIHPRLVSSDQDSEISQVRWKNMEPHDVVNECARMSLDYLDKPQESQQIAGNECPCYSTPIKPAEFNAVTTIDFQWKASVNYFNTISTDQKLSTIAAQNSFWSPSNMMQPTPPPGPATVPHTPNPTPSYTIPSISGPQLPAADGASPPEAAVEATPETTPMKDIVKPVRPYPVNSTAVRAMWNTSQPSSPIKKEASHFSYEKSVITSQKLLRMVNDRNHSVLQMPANPAINTTTATSTTSNSVPSSPLPVDQPAFEITRLTHLVSNVKLSSGETTRFDSPTISQPDCTQEDQEVHEINSQHLLHELSPMPLLPTKVVPHQLHSVHPMKEAFDVEDFEQEEGSPCSAGGLHFKNSQSMINFTRHRYRMHSQCVVDSDPSYSTGTSPADTSSYMLKNGSGISTARGSNGGVTKKHQRRHSLPDLKKYSLRVDPKTLAGERLDPTLVETNGDSSSGSSPSEEEAISAATHFHKKQEQKTEEHIRRNLELFQEIRKNLTNVGSCHRAGQNGIPASSLISSSTQTIESYPQPYEQIVYGILQEEMKYKSDIVMKRLQERCDSDSKPDPNLMLDKYIELCVKKRLANGDPRKTDELYRDHITLLTLQLQYEKHRREIHAERNRRLLGKSRVIRGLEQNNDTLKDQVSRLTKEISSLNLELAELRRKTNADWNKSSSEVIELKERYVVEVKKSQDLQTQIKELENALIEETRAHKDQSMAVEQARGELFDLRNEMQQALQKADLGQQYRDELTRLQCELILMGEIQLKCKERLGHLDNFKARDVENAMIQETYLEEVKDLNFSLEMKSAQLDSAKERLIELEQQLVKRDETIALQKRMLKTVKEEHKEQFNALERKYQAQKAIVIKMEEAILESRVSTAVRSPDSDRTDAVGSLDHTSPLSISLASSEGLSEIKNLALVVQSGSGCGNLSNLDLDSNQPTPLGGSHPQMDKDITGAIGLVVTGRPPLSSGNLIDDTVIPGPSQRL